VRSVDPAAAAALPSSGVGTLGVRDESGYAPAPPELGTSRKSGA